jgi:hypothetical protein
MEIGFRIACLAICALPIGTMAVESFQGALDNHPIWLDLQLPKADGPITGAYFYPKHGTPIQLSGKKAGDSLIMKESIGNKVTGVFRLVLKPMSEESPKYPFARFGKMEIYGNWNKPGKRSTLPVSGYQTDPGYKACVMINPDSLTTAQSESFGREMDEHTKGEKANPQLEYAPISREYEISGCGRGFFSVHISWVYTSSQHELWRESGSARHVFDLATRQEVVLGSEIDSSKAKAFSEYMGKILNPTLAEKIPGQTLDSVGFDFYLEDKKILVGAIFTDSDGEGVVSAVEIFDTIPFQELRKYLRSNSVLQNVGQN